MSWDPGWWRGEHRRGSYVVSGLGGGGLCLPRYRRGNRCFSIAPFSSQTHGAAIAAGTAVAASTAVARSPRGSATVVAATEHGNGNPQDGGQSVIRPLPRRERQPPAQQEEEDEEEEEQHQAQQPYYHQQQQLQQQPQQNQQQQHQRLQ